MTEYKNGDESTDPTVIAQKDKGMNAATQARYSFPDKRHPLAGTNPKSTITSVTTYLFSSFNDLNADGQQIVLLHELRHGVGYGPEIDQNYKGEMADIAKKCPKQDIATTPSPSPTEDIQPK